MIQKPFLTINMEATGRNIKALRKKNKYSVKDLQEYFGFEYPQAIYKWQWGQTLPDIQNLVCLSMLFHVSIDDILVIDSEDVVDCAA